MNGKINVVFPYNGVLAIKKNKALVCATTYMNLENIMLSEKLRHKGPHIV